MSTTFGVKIPSTGETVEVARRVGAGKGRVTLYWTEPLAELLIDETKVEALDNSSQGIYCIGDIKKHIEEQSNREEIEE